MASPGDLWPGRDRQSAFMRSVGLELDDIGPDLVRGHLDVGPDHHQLSGIVHGGVYCAVVEAAASIGASTAVADRGQTCTGVNNNTHFIRGIDRGRLEVVARPIQVGGTQQLWDVRITDDEQRLVATGQVRLQNLQRRDQG